MDIGVSTLVFNVSQISDDELPESDAENDMAVDAVGVDAAAMPTRGGGVLISA